MYLVHVIPLTPTGGSETLTYFSGKEYQAGEVLEIPLRKKKAHAVVYASEPLKNAKARIRRSDFALKKIDAAARTGSIEKSVLSAGEYTARFHATGLGATLFHIVPQGLLQKNPPRIEETPEKKLKKKEDLCLELSRTERERAYMTLAERAPLAITAPTIAELEHLQKVGEDRGYSTALLHGGLSKKTLEANIRASGAAHMLFATPSFIPLARADMHTLIIEREGSELYRARTRGHVDMRVFLTAFARERGMRVVRGDLPLRTELVREDTHVTRSSAMPQGLALPVIVHMKRKKNGAENPQEKKTPFRTISPELENAVRAAFLEKGRALIWSARRGLAPVTVCNDCGTSVVCPLCGAPLVLHGAQGKRIYLCHACGAIHRSNILCKNCGSWNLIGLGLGTERTAEDARILFPNATIMRFDSDAITTHRAAKKTSEDFYRTEHALMIATDMALPYLHTPIETIGVASLDTLLALPAWNIYEKTLATLCALQALARHTFIIQTRQKEHELFETLASGDLASFHTRERTMRKEFGYPPETILIKLSFEGTRESAMRELPAMRRALQDATDILTLPVVTKGKKVLHTLIARVPRHDWPHANMILLLRALSPRVDITINPTRLL